MADLATWDRQTDLLAVAVELLDVIARKGSKRGRRPLVTINRPKDPRRAQHVRHGSPEFNRLFGGRVRPSKPDQAEGPA